MPQRFQTKKPHKRTRAFAAVLTVPTGLISGRDFLFYFWRKRVRKTSRTKGPQ